MAAGNRPAERKNFIPTFTLIRKLRSILSPGTDRRGNWGEPFYHHRAPSIRVSGNLSSLRVAEAGRARRAAGQRIGSTLREGGRSGSPRGRRK